ncbi:MAG: STAS domain-containing protein [Deltaproteobacteria bacterium]|nr:STAS domain-containing protein [Deltaproteobacteria bacterium]
MTDHDSSIKSSDNCIQIKGSLCGKGCNALIDAYHQLPRDTHILLDFSETHNIDPMGINALVMLCILVHKRNQRLVAEGLSQELREVFHLTMIDDSIRMGPPTAADTLSSTRKISSLWAEPFAQLRLGHHPSQALDYNIDGLKLTGPLQGFGQLWEKTYQVRLSGVKISPRQAVKVMRERFPSFQPDQNHFYPSRAGIIPGEIVIINSVLLGVPISTGVFVLYADDTSFTFMTPQGHPESGWVHFRAYEDEASTIMQIQGFARANDLFYEIGFKLAGSRIQENIWKHVLTQFAGYFGLDGWVQVSKSCIDESIQWANMKNIWYNAQIRTLLYLARQKRE